MELGLSGQMDKLNINMNKKGAAATVQEQHTTEAATVSTRGRSLLVVGRCRSSERASCTELAIS